MIYWELISDFLSACKALKWMSYEEYESILHTNSKKYSEQFSINFWKVKRLKDACRHYCNLQKLDLVYRKKYGHPPKIEMVRFGDAGEYIEYWYLADNKKKRKICGYPKKGHPAGWLCLNSPGKYTLHQGYGYCMEHEMLQLAEPRKKIWLQLAKMHKVANLEVLITRAEQVDALIVKGMEGDLAYLEIARQAVLRRAEEAGGNFTRDMHNDLAIVSEIIAKVKALKVKVEQMNWIPPDQVSAMILQVLDAVTINEDPEVRRRIAMRAKELATIIVPRVEEKNPEYSPYKRTKEVQQAMQVAEEYVEEKNFDWASHPGMAGYETSKAEIKKVPNYKKNHSFLKKKESI